MTGLQKFEPIEILLFASFFLFLIFYIAFYFVSAKRIRRNILNDGLEDPLYSSLIGGPSIEYSMAIVVTDSGAKRLQPLIDAFLIRKYANTLDKTLAISLLTSLILFFITMVISAVYD